MIGLSGPVKSVLSGFALAVGGLSVYNLSQRPTTQTVQGVDNTTLVVIAAATAFIIWMRK